MNQTFFLSRISLEVLGEIEIFGGIERFQLRIYSMDRKYAHWDLLNYILEPCLYGSVNQISCGAKINHFRRRGTRLSNYLVVGCTIIRVS